MIIQRIVSAIKRQDLSQIIIEILIVMIGIFLGLQVTDWNEDRQNSELESQYLERLWTDLDQSRKALLENEKFHYDIYENIRDIVAWLMQDNESSAAPDPNLRIRFANFPDPEVELGTYEELISTGRLALISDHLLRQEVQSYVTQYARSLGDRSFRRNNAIRYRDKMGTYYHFEFDDEGELLRMLDFSNLADDQIALNAFAAGGRLHRIMSTNTAQDYEATNKLFNMLSCSLNKPDCIQDFN